MANPRILILTASAGNGHISAALAIETALKKIAPEVEVKNVDLLEISAPLFGALYGEGYTKMIKYKPELWGWLYHVTDQDPKRVGTLLDRMRFTFQRTCLHRLSALIRSEPWDLIISTHFMASELVASMKRERKTDALLATVITDFVAHRFWVNEPCERYYAATNEVKIGLRANWNVPAEKISVTGIPIHPSFEEPFSKEQCLYSIGLAGDRPMILQLAGVSGIGPVMETYRQILSMETPLDVIVCYGRNEAARKKMESVSCPKRHRVKMIGLTTQMHLFLSAADLVISKSGGLTSAECLACGTPLVVLNPLPGQEVANGKYLIRQGAGVAATIQNIAGHLASILKNKDKMRMMKENARRIAKPSAARDIVNESLKMILKNKTFSAIT